MRCNKQILNMKVSLLQSYIFTNAQVGFKSLSFSFLNPQITYMIFINSQSLKQYIVLEDRYQECFLIGCHKTKPKVIPTINQSKGKHYTLQ